MAQSIPRGAGISPEDDIMRTALDAVHQTGQLIRAELALAKAEFYHELKLAAGAAAALVGALVLVECALVVWAGALVLWLGTRGWIAALVGVGFAVLAGLCTYAAIVLLTRRHLARTRARVRQDVRSIRESTHG